MAHSRASVYSDDERKRHEHNGIVKWIDAVLAGDLEARYVAQAEAELGVASETSPEGDPWMAPDGLDS
jgi:hypothetical protein